MKSLIICVILLSTLLQANSTNEQNFMYGDTISEDEFYITLDTQLGMILLTYRESGKYRFEDMSFECTGLEEAMFYKKKLSIEQKRYMHKLCIEKSKFYIKK